MVSSAFLMLAQYHQSQHRSFSLGDDPALFIRLCHLYSTNFKHNLRITSFLKQPTIAGHARLLLENVSLEA